MFEEEIERPGRLPVRDVWEKDPVSPVWTPSKRLRSPSSPRNDHAYTSSEMDTTVPFQPACSSLCLGPKPPSDSPNSSNVYETKVKEKRRKERERARVGENKNTLSMRRGDGRARRDPPV